MSVIKKGDPRYIETFNLNKKQKEKRADSMARESNL